MGCFWAREDGGLLRRRDGGGCAVVVGLGLHGWWLPLDYRAKRVRGGDL